VVVSFYEPYVWYTRNPWFEYESISHEAINSLNLNLNNLIINYIDRGYYILAIVNDFFIPDRQAYQKFNLKHDILLYRYDFMNKRFDAIGYNKDGTYGHSFVDFDDFEKSFFSIDNNDLIFYTLNGFYNHNFSIESTVELLKDYLYSRNTSSRLKVLDGKRYISDHAFGLDVYYHLKNYFHLLITKQANFDIRSLHMLYEHKECMISRIKFLEENGYLKNSSEFLDGYNKIRDKIKTTKNLQLKYKLTRNNYDIQKIITILDEVAREEKVIIENILNNLC
jgi:hypothetical protein